MGRGLPVGAQGATAIVEHPEQGPECVSSRRVTCHSPEVVQWRHAIQGARSVADTAPLGLRRHRYRQRIRPVVAAVEPAFDGAGQAAVRGRKEPQ
ncbi:hypothetical protein D3C81_1670580 [compost metagenome]